MYENVCALIFVKKCNRINALFIEIGGIVGKVHDTDDYVSRDDVLYAM